MRKSISFALQRAIGSRAGGRYRDFRTLETWSAERCEAWKSARLREVLERARNNVPFYRGRGGSSLADFPVLTKADLAAHFRDLMAPALRAEFESGRSSSRYGWLEVTSGGTTGVPTTVIHGPGFRDMDRAARVYELDLAGFPFGTPHYRLWGSMNDLQHTRSSLQNRIMSTLSGEHLLNAFRMEQADVERYLDLLDTGCIRYLLAYVDAAEALARHALRTGRTPRPLRSIMTTGGTLTGDTRVLLAKVFGARIHNKYGSRDAGELACECSEGGLHILAPNVHIEILDRDDRALPPGETGRIVVTFLGNHEFPLIRYDIGDMGAWTESPCACGRPFPCLARLEGRATDFLTSTKGGFVSPVYIRHLVGVVHGQRDLRRFQLVQESPARHRLQLEPEEGVSANRLAARLPALERDLKHVLGDEAHIEILISDHIPESASGKFQYTINRNRPS